jgi:class 3 adenylate cyclase
LLNQEAIKRSFEHNKSVNTSLDCNNILTCSGKIFIGRKDKLIIYNGTSCSQINLVGQVLLAYTSDSIVYFTAKNTVGYLVPDSLQTFQVYYLNDLLPDKLRNKLDITGILTIDKTVFFQTDTLLFCFDTRLFTILDTVSHNSKIFKCGQNLITLDSGNHIRVYNQNVQVQNLEFQGDPIYSILKHETGYLIVTTNKTCLMTDNSFKVIAEWPLKGIAGFKNGAYQNSSEFIVSENENTILIFQVSSRFYSSWWAYIIYVALCGIICFILYKTYLLNLHKARGSTSSTTEIKTEESRNPEIITASEPNAANKKFDLFSNIDEDKVKDKTPWIKYEMVTVLFSDIQGFTKIAESMNPELLIDELDRFFYHFDSVVEKYSIEKIKTIGDAYMAAGGIPKKSNTNPIEVVLAALEMQNYMKQLKKSKIDIWDLRIGIHSGPVIAGIIGHKKRSFDIWGDTVNTASRMETTGEAGKVNISGETYKFVKDYFLCEYRGKLPVKYKGNIDMYFVKGLRPELSINLGGLPNRKFYLKLQILRLTDLEEFVMSHLEKELDKNLYFHNYEYACHLYEYAGLLAKATDLDMEETLLIRTAALFLNSGFTGGYENQENRSAEFARNILPEFNYSEKQISIISNLILSSKWPPEPNNLLEMVLYDTKMEYIGRADFIKLYKNLFHEQNHYNRSGDAQEFKQNQIDIILQYPFFTDSARRLREVSITEQISRIREDFWEQ